MLKKNKIPKPSIAFCTMCRVYRLPAGVAEPPKNLTSPSSLIPNDSIYWLQRLAFMFSKTLTLATVNNGGWWSIFTMHFVYS